MGTGTCQAVGAWQVRVAVVGEGDGAEGAMSLFLPVEEPSLPAVEDRVRVAGGKPVEEPPPVAVAPRMADVDVRDGAVFAALRHATAAQEAPVRVSAPGGVAVARVLQTVDLAVRASAPRVLRAERTSRPLVG